MKTCENVDVHSITIRVGNNSNMLYISFSVGCTLQLPVVLRATAVALALSTATSQQIFNSINLYVPSYRVRSLPGFIHCRQSNMLSQPVHVQVCAALSSLSVTSRSYYAHLQKPLPLQLPEAQSPLTLQGEPLTPSPPPPPPPPLPRTTQLPRLGLPSQAQKEL